MEHCISTGLQKYLKISSAENMEKNSPIQDTQQKTNSYLIPPAKHTDVRKKYHVSKKEIGRGGYGVVRMCVERKSGRKFAIKTINKSRIQRPEMIVREIRNQRMLSHPDIIGLRDVYEDENYIHLIMPLCTGGELFHRIVEKNLGGTTFREQEVIGIAKSIIDSVAYCHSKGVVHRDVKPENFVFESKKANAAIKLIDFGLSANFHPDDQDHVMERCVGTLSYVAPEVLDCRYNSKCDVWSAGVIIYILLCGYPPFCGESDAETIQAIKYGKLCFPNAEWETVSLEAKSLLRLLLCKNPDRRPTAAQAGLHSWFQKSVELNSSSSDCEIKFYSALTTTVRNSESIVKVYSDHLVTHRQ